MSSPDSILLTFGNTQARVLVTDTEEEKSVRTGRALEVVHATIQARGAETHELFMAAVNATQQDFRSDDAERGQRQWDVRIDSWSQTDDRYGYRLELREHDDVMLAALVIDGMEFVPIRYEETLQGPGISATAVVSADEATADRLRALMDSPEYFTVVRRGISDEPVEMRFGMCGWSQHGATTKHQLYLVDRRTDGPDDDRPSDSIVLVDRANVRKSLAYSIELIEQLLELLVGKGVISAGELSDLHDAADRGRMRREHEFRRVRDAEALS